MAARPAPLIAVVGPTASGKSAFALRLAEERDGEIVSCDSLQVYRGLDIGSAKPTADERARVPHHLLDVVDPDQPFSAADYARLGREALAGIRTRGRLAVVAGGTGLYLRALLRGLFAGPARQTGLRDRLEAIASRHGDARLHRLLRRVDPAAARRIEVRDRVRVVRALEVYWTTGRPLSEQRTHGLEPLEGFDVLVLGLAPAREELQAAVEARSAAMFKAGLLEEVRGLLARYPDDLRPLQAIGYRQALAVVRGRLGPADAVRDMVKDTMRYAKRQRTWFRHQEDTVWCATASLARERALAWLSAR
jgi:tRNA dimethylallyltransferase